MKYRLEEQRKLLEDTKEMLEQFQGACDRLSYGSFMTSLNQYREQYNLSMSEAYTNMRLLGQVSVPLSSREMGRLEHIMTITKKEGRQ